MSFVNNICYDKPLESGPLLTHPHSGKTCYSIMQVIAQYSKPEDAYLASSVLEANGIDVEVWDDKIVNVNWFYSNAVGGVKLTVSEDEVEKAKAILDFRKSEPGFVACPNCGSLHTSMRDLNPWHALGLALFSVPIPLGKQVFDCLACKRAFKPEVEEKGAGKKEG